MDTQRISEPTPRVDLAPSLGGPVRRRRGGRWKSIQAEARRRRLVANALVVGTTGAVLALAALFNHVLSH